MPTYSLQCLHPFSLHTFGCDAPLNIEWHKHNKCRTQEWKTIRLVELLESRPP